MKQSNVISLQAYVTDLNLMERLVKRQADKAELNEAKRQQLTNDRYNQLDRIFMQFDTISKKQRGA